MRQIYVASSWRNQYQPTVVRTLRSWGHWVYDFRNPTVGYHNPEGLEHGFRWSDIDTEYKAWSVTQYIELLDHPIAQQGFNSDKEAMEWADTCVLVLPSGPSSHMEAGWMAGKGKEVHVLILEPIEPDLMYKLAYELHPSYESLCDALDL